jgi:acetyltransferase-like isoleucine patch superfamily enzyme
MRTALARKWGTAARYSRKWLDLEPNSLPWNRVRIHLEFARRDAYVSWPVRGNVLEAMREGRLEVGPDTWFEPHVWISAHGWARIRIGARTNLNFGVMVTSEDLVEIGDDCMIANGTFISDVDHKFDMLDRPLRMQGYTMKGPTRIGNNVWLGANVVVTSGVTIGDRAVIGANSVVTRDIPAYAVAAGVPARVIRIWHEEPVTETHRA